MLIYNPQTPLLCLFSPDLTLRVFPVQFGQQSVFVFPQLVDPALERQFVGRVLVVVFADKLRRDLQFFKDHHHVTHVAAQQVPITRASARVMNRHVDDRLQLFAHRIQHKGNAPGLGLEQVAKR